MREVLSSADRVEFSRAPTNDAELRAVEAVLRRLKQDSPGRKIDVIMSAHLDGGAVSVGLEYVWRGEDGTPRFVPGGHSVFLVDTNGEIVRVIGGA